MVFSSQVIILKVSFEVSTSEKGVHHLNVTIVSSKAISLVLCTYNAVSIRQYWETMSWKAIKNHELVFLITIRYFSRCSSSRKNGFRLLIFIFQIKKNAFVSLLLHNYMCNFIPQCSAFLGWLLMIDVCFFFLL